jgi:uncharacterized protein YciI
MDSQIATTRRATPVSIFLLVLLASLSADAQMVKESTATAYDSTLAASVGADDYGMHRYVLVILKTGPKPMPKGPERDAMFKGHFANMNRLAEAGVLVQAGPLDGVDGWRGLFVLAVDSIATAKRHVATDPVIINGEMVAEYHTHYGSAALMLLNGLHKRLEKKRF